MNKYETHFVVWSDGSVTLLRRERKEDRLDEWVSETTMTKEESQEFYKTVRNIPQA